MFRSNIETVRLKYSISRIDILYSTIPEGVPLTAQSEGPVPVEGGLACFLYLYSKCST